MFKLLDAEWSGPVVATCSRHQRQVADQKILLNVENPSDWNVLGSRPPQLLIYCAGVCNVQRCETDPRFAWSVNVGGVASMLDALPESTALVYISSDHVFSGRDRLYLESSTPDPLSTYGETRVAAERLISKTRPDALIVRVGLCIGTSPCGRVGHLDWLRYRHARGLPMTVIDGEFRSAVWADDAAMRILALASRRVRGFRHVVATRAVSRPQLAQALCVQYGLAGNYDVKRRGELPHPSPRPRGTWHEVFRRSCEASPESCCIRGNSEQGRKSTNRSLIATSEARLGVRRLGDFVEVGL